MTSLVAAARDKLAGESTVTALLGSDTEFTVWIFEDRLFARVEGTESVALVLRQRGSWTSPNGHNTLRFPRLLVEVYVDPTRDSDGMVTDVVGADLRGDAVYRAVDAVLHRAAQEAQTWGTGDRALRTVGCQRLDEPEPADVPDGDGLRVLRVNYGVTVG